MKTILLALAAATLFTVPAAAIPSVPLSSIANPPSKVAIANVRDANGKMVGAVQRVDLGPSGAPAEVTIALIGKTDREVVLDAASVTYNPVKNEILARESGRQLKAMSHIAD
jgi:hypothetical protein